MTDSTSNGSRRTSAGPIAEEALRLFAAVQDWAQRSLPEDDSHSGSDCQWCPLCQFVAVLRGDRPEVTARVAEAGTAVASAVRALLEAAGDAREAATDGGGAGGQHRHETESNPPVSRVQRIDLGPWVLIMVLAVGVDIGGTKICAGVVDPNGQVIDRERRPTPGHDVAETEDLIVDVVSALAARHEIAAVGIGAAGWIANDHATVLFSPHLAWRDEPLLAGLTGRIGLPLFVENDANAAAWAEYRFGSAQGRLVVVCVTLGTGIGGGLVVSGSIYRGAFGIACEYGHMTLVPEGRLCACGNRGCWEMYASGRALARDARDLIADSPVAAARLLALAGSAAEVDGPVVTAAAAEGDPAASSICTNMGRWLGRGLANLAAVLDPSIFVIGGGVSEAGELLLRPAREEYAHTLTGRGFRPVADVVVAALGPDAGLVGAADLARRAHTAG